MTDTLEQDFITVPGQLYALISIVGPDCPQKTDKFGIKIRGVFNTRDEAGSHAQRLQKNDPTFDIYVVDMYKWLLVPPDSKQIDDVTYQEEFLQNMMTEYRENQSSAKRMFEERKAGMIEKSKEALEANKSMPYITAGDDNSKYYTKPDQAPSAHPSEYLDDLKVKNPDKDMEELVKMATELADAENERRKEIEEVGIISKMRKKPKRKMKKSKRKMKKPKRKNN